MRILAVVHLYPPAHNAGAEWMLHSVLRDLISRGHEAHVVYPNAPSYKINGVKVSETPTDLAELVRGFDVVFTHLDKTREAMRAAVKAERPIVHFVHNDQQLTFNRVSPSPNTLVVSNSTWIQSTVPREFNSLIVRPPVFGAEYQVDKPENRDCVTLINLSRPKGSRMFFWLAAKEPNRKFLAVMGAYGIQDRQKARRLPNVEAIENTPDIVKDVYARTRVLLMPSDFESWGRVGIEAAASGIPTIAHPTPGLLESLGIAGTFVDRKDSEGWLRELKRLDDPIQYEQASRRAVTRAEKLTEVYTADLENFAAALVNLCSDRKWVREVVGTV